LKAFVVKYRLTLLCHPWGKATVFEDKTRI
jgi:hypothetical protein